VLYGRRFDKNCQHRDKLYDLQCRWMSFFASLTHVLTDALATETVNEYQYLDWTSA
jgi:hypothetical protein